MIEDYWRAFCDKTGFDVRTVYDSFSFGNSPEMADRLGKLVIEGKKTGTSSGYDLYLLDNEPLPQKGDISIMLDGASCPIGVVRNTAVEILPFSSITEEHARLEGEGDLSLDYWQQVHISFLSPYYREAGLTFNENSLIVYEHFEVLYSE